MTFDIFIVLLTESISHSENKDESKYMYQMNEKIFIQMDNGRAKTHTSNQHTSDGHGIENRIDKNDRYRTLLFVKYICIVLFCFVETEILTHPE